MAQNLEQALERAKKTIQQQDEMLKELTSMPFYLATVAEIRENGQPVEDDYSRLEVGTKVKIIGQHHGERRLIGRIGDIVSDVDEDGEIMVDVGGGFGEWLFFTGANGKAREIQFVEKQAAPQSVILIHDGKLLEVKKPKKLELKPGDPVRVSPKTMQIVDGGGAENVGEIALIKNNIGGGFAEIDFHDTTRVVRTGQFNGQLKKDDRVVLDSSGNIVLRNLGQDDKRFIVKQTATISWEDIGGLHQAIEEMRNAVETPYTDAERFKAYGMKLIKGILLMGPHGNGKTLLGRATATAIARVHGKEASDSSFLYVKGPEILDKWVGNSEAAIRQLFQRARLHKLTHGFPAVIFIDEAESILRKRGGGVSSDMESTIVPMFLAEMDGMEESGALVILATNRADILDPAITREGRIDRKLFIDRPNKADAAEIFKIHLRKSKLAKGLTIEQITQAGVEALFAETLVYYEITRTDQDGKKQMANFTLANLASGAMIAGIVEQATSLAFNRDRREKKVNGMTLDDVRSAVLKVYEANRHLNHRDELAEFTRDYRDDVTGIKKLRSAAAA